MPRRVWLVVSYPFGELGLRSKAGFDRFLKGVTAEVIARTATAYLAAMPARAFLPFCVITLFSDCMARVIYHLADFYLTRENGGFVWPRQLMLIPRVRTPPAPAAQPLSLRPPGHGFLSYPATNRRLFRSLCRILAKKIRSGKSRIIPFKIANYLDSRRSQ